MSGAALSQPVSDAEQVVWPRICVARGLVSVWLFGSPSSNSCGVVVDGKAEFLGDLLDCLLGSLPGLCLRGEV